MRYACSVKGLSVEEKKRVLSKLSKTYDLSYSSSLLVFLSDCKHFIWFSDDENTVHDSGVVYWTDLNTVPRMYNIVPTPAGCNNLGEM